MDSLQWEKINQNEFNVFMRDLSMTSKTNLKHMIEDMNNENQKKKQNKNHNKKKKVVVKKKDLIIAEQNKKRHLKNIENDTKTIDFLLRNLDNKNPYLNFDKLKTEEGKLEYKCKLLENYWKKKKKYLHHVFNLYYHLYQQKDQLQDKSLQILTKIESILSDYDCKSYMLKELGHLLPPLNYWDQGPTKLDDWQKEVVDKIYQGISVLVKAPTSSGKTFIAMATGIIHKKILYVCPAKPVAYQVGANFIKMGYKVHYFVENHSQLSYDSQTNIFIGTPDIIEDNLIKISNDFDYAVFDEIHTLGLWKSYENIIKCINCNFLALSATIENIEYLKDLFVKIHPKKRIAYIEYKKRFINQQRWIYMNDKIEKVHPCICLETDNFDSFEMITFTPHDCITLYEELDDIFEEIYEEDEKVETMIDNISPDKYFTEEKLLTLDDTKEYESFLKDKLKELYGTYPKQIEELKNRFTKRVEINETIEDMIPFLNDCKKKDCLPLLYFHTDEMVSKEIFMKLYELLNKEEELNYPYHYELLEKKNEFYEDYLKKRDIYSSNIKIKTKDAHTEKEEKLERFDNDAKNKYVEIMMDFYTTCIGKCKDSENEVKKIKNLKDELKYFLENPDLRKQDIFKKHPKYCYSRGEPMSGQEIKSIRKEIRNALGVTISYENPIFQLLKRGIGLYIESMPDVYNWILQKLMSERKLGVVISDRTLCLGIDLPIRSVALSGYKNPEYTTSDYLQMSGRAGRRGLDDRGNIIFHNVKNYLELMKGSLPKLELVEDEVYDTYNIVTKINYRINVNKIVVKSEIECSPKMEKLMWSLRSYKKCKDFIKKCNRLEKELFMEIDSDREYKLIEIIITILVEDETIMDCYKANKIQNHGEFININHLGEITKNIYNHLDDYTYRIVRVASGKIFTRCKNIIYNYRGFE
jgi:hypothetical protein